jgi:ferredoxin
MKVKLTFADIGLTVTVPAGTRIIQISEKAGSNITYDCRENDCGNCIVEIVSGMENLSKPSALEKALLAEKRAGPNHRLACQTAVMGDATVRPPLRIG